MFDDLDPPKKSKAFQIGQPLDGFSVQELEQTIEILQDEIARLQADIQKKKASQEAAASIFKS